MAVVVIIIVAAPRWRRIAYALAGLSRWLGSPAAAVLTAGLGIAAMAPFGDGRRLWIGPRLVHPGGLRQGTAIGEDLLPDVTP